MPMIVRRWRSGVRSADPEPPSGNPVSRARCPPARARQQPARQPCASAQGAQARMRERDERAGSRPLIPCRAVAIALVALRHRRRSLSVTASGIQISGRAITALKVVCSPPVQGRTALRRGGLERDRGSRKLEFARTRVSEIPDAGFRPAPSVCQKWPGGVASHRREDPRSRSADETRRVGALARWRQARRDGLSAAQAARATG